MDFHCIDKKNTFHSKKKGQTGFEKASSVSKWGPESLFLHELVPPKNTIVSSFMSFQTCMHLVQKTEEDILKNADNQTGLVPIFLSI